MVDYSLDVDFGSTGQGGPWLRWHAKISQDGLFTPGTWSLKDGDGSHPVDPSRGMVFDWPSSRTGWMLEVASGAPEKRWNA